MNPSISLCLKQITAMNSAADNCKYLPCRCVSYVTNRDYSVLNRVNNDELMRLGRNQTPLSLRVANGLIKSPRGLYVTSENTVEIIFGEENSLKNVEIVEAAGWMSDFGYLASGADNYLVLHGSNGNHGIRVAQLNKKVDTLKQKVIASWSSSVTGYGQLVALKDKTLVFGRIPELPDSDNLGTFYLLDLSQNLQGDRQHKPQPQLLFDGAFKHHLPYAAGNPIKVVPRGILENIL